MKKYLAILTVGLMLAGCSGKPNLLPEEEASYNEISSLIDSTKADLDSAARAGANDYAPDSMTQARSDLQTASNTLDIKDFARAKEYANKANKEARDVLTLPVSTQNTITDAESLLNSAKVSGADISSPANYKDAYDNLAAAKAAYEKNIYDTAKIKAVASAEASRKAMYEPSAAKKSIAALADSLKLAKDLQMDTLKADVYNAGADALAASSTDFAAGLLPKAGDEADKARGVLEGEMRASVDLAIQQARGDIGGAKEAGASEFASEKLASAETALAAANGFQKNGEFLNAKKYAEKASAAAKAAAEKARTGKEAANITPSAVVTEQPPAVSTPQEQEPEAMVQAPAKTVPPIVTREEPRKEAPKIETPKKTRTEEPMAPRKTGLQPTPAAAAKTAPGAPVDGNMAVPIGVGIVIVITCLFLIRTLRMKITAAKREAEIQDQAQDQEQNQAQK